VSWNHQRSPFGITQNNDPSIIDAGGYVCGSSASPYYYNTDDWAMRRYTAAGDDLGNPYGFEGVDYATRYFRYGNLAQARGPYTITCYAFSIPSSSILDFEYLIELTHTDVQVDSSFTPFSPHSLALDAGINDTASNDLVVAFFMPMTYYLTPQFRYSPGCSNAPGDTRECYYAFTDCGTPEPTTPSDLGSPNAAKLIEVLGPLWWPGHSPCCSPDGSCRLAVLGQGCVAPDIWHPEWVTCIPNPCPLPGPCCDPATEACTIVQLADCVSPLVWVPSLPECSPTACAILGVNGAHAAGRLSLRIAPSPSAGPVHISCRLPEAGTLRLQIFSPSGTMVRRLEAVNRPAGEHETIWDGLDDAGHPVPSGVYWIRAETRAGSVTEKVVLARE
jgi:hypothetical protein